MKKIAGFAAARNAAIAIFIALLAVGGFAIDKLASRTTIDPASFAHAGRIIKEKFPAYASSTDEEIGRLLYGKGYVTEEQRFVLKSAGLSDSDIDNLVARKSYSPRVAALIYAGLVAVLGAGLFGTLAFLGRRSRVSADEKATTDS